MRCDARARWISSWVVVFLHCICWQLASIGSVQLGGLSCMPLLQFALISGSLGNKIVKESQGKGCGELLALADYWQLLLRRRIPGQAWAYLCSCFTLYRPAALTNAAIVDQIQSPVCLIRLRQVLLCVHLSKGVANWQQNLFCVCTCTMRR